MVETARGWQLGQVVDLPANPKPPTDGGWKAIDRIATASDLQVQQQWQAKEAEVVTRARTRAIELKLQGIKVVNAEYSFDGSRLVINFTSESEDKVELKSLRPDMQKAFAPAGVEIRQVGPRDVAKVFNGLGACGLERRCCSTFLTEFSSISIKMAKEQGISLTPGEITGICGRLRCCLNYEYEQYCTMRQDLPRKNKRVMTPSGEGKVIDVAVLRQRVIVELPESGRREFDKAEVTVLEDDGTLTSTPVTQPVEKTETGGTSEPTQPKPAFHSRPQSRPPQGGYNRQKEQAARHYQPANPPAKPVKRDYPRTQPETQASPEVKEEKPLEIKDDQAQAGRKTSYLDEIRNAPVEVPEWRQQKGGNRPFDRNKKSNKPPRP